MTLDASTSRIAPTLLRSLTAAETTEDLRRCRVSSHCLTYASICINLSDIENRFTIAELRLFLQILLNNARFKIIRFRGVTLPYGLERCRACGGTGGTLEHLLFACEYFESDRHLCGLHVGPASLPSVLAGDPAGTWGLLKFVKRIWSRAVDSLCVV